MKGAPTHTLTSTIPQTLQAKPTTPSKPLSSTAILTQSSKLNTMNDFIIGIQTEFQQDMLIKYGNQCVCMDAMLLVIQSVRATVAINA